MTRAVSSSVKDVSFLAAMTCASSGLNFIGTYVLAKLLGPEQYGQWQILQIILWYVVIMDLGVGVGIARDVPVLLGQRDDDLYRRTSGTVLAWNMAVSGLALAGCWAAARFGSMPPFLKENLPLVGLFAFIACFSSYSLAMLYAHQGLRMWSFLTFLRSLLRLAVCVSLFPLGLKALMLGWIVCELPIPFLVRRANPAIRFHRGFDGKVLRRLFVLGFPLFLLTFVQWQARLGDRTLAAMFLDQRSVGVYGLAAVFSSFLVSLSIQVSQTMHTRILRRFGETQDVGSLKDQILEPCRAVSRVYPFLIGLVWAVTPWLFHTWLPEYGGAVQVLQILSAASFFLAVPQTQGSLLVVLEKYWTQFWIWCAVLGLNLAACYVLLSKGWGITGIATATGCSWLFGFALNFGITLPYHLAARRAWLYVGQLMGPFLYAAALLAASAALVRALSVGPAGSLFVTLAVLSAGYGPLLLKVNRDLQVLASVRDYLAVKTGLERSRA